MTITLNAQLEKLVQDKVLRGEYESAEALVDAAVRSLIDEEQSENLSPCEIAAIELGVAELERGEYIEYDLDEIHQITRDVQSRGLRRLAAED